MKMAVVGGIKGNMLEEVTVPIDDSTFSQIDKARNDLLEMLDMEITYDHIMEEFTSFKGKMKESNIRALRGVLYRGHEHIHETRSSLNRTAFNLLNLSKFYLDKHCYDNQSKSFVLNLTANKKLHEEVVKLRRSAFENNLYYTFGGVLRNVVQHHQLPVESMSSGISRANLQDKPISSFSLPIDMNKVAPLVKPNADKRAMAKVLEDAEFKPDLHKILDGYVYALGTFHTLNRTLVADAIKDAKRVLREFEIEVMGGEFQPDTSVRIIDLLEYTGDDEAPLFHLDLSWYKVADYLQNKNGRAVDYSQFEFNSYL
ncbi:MAG: hypothetical protein ACJAXJ_004185 [Colwellia sp.]|jgi:hypothetical protein